MPCPFVERVFVVPSRVVVQLRNRPKTVSRSPTVDGVTLLDPHVSQCVSKLTVSACDITYHRGTDLRFPKGTLYRQ